MIKIVKYTPDSATSKVYLEIDGNEYFTEFATLIYYRGIGLVARFVSIPFRNTFDVVAPLSEIQYNGTTGITPEVLTVLVANNLSTEPAPVDPDVWVRNPDWPAIPDTDDMAYIVWAVFDDEPVNQISVSVNSQMIINWGDGTSSNSGGATRTKSYNYAAIDAPVCVSFDGRTYKPVLISIDRNGGTAATFHIHVAPLTNIHANNSLEIVDRLAGAQKNYRLGYAQGIAARNVSTRYLEHLYLNSECSSVMAGFLFNSIRLKKIVIPARFVQNNDAQACFAGSFCDINFPDISFANTVLSNLFFQNCFLREVGNITGGTSYNNFFARSSVTKIGIITSTATDFSGAFIDTTRLWKIQRIDAPIINLDNAFVRSNIAELEMSNCGGITNTNLTFNGCVFLRKLIMTGMRIGFNISGNALQAAALNALFTSLGTANGAQTINVSLNPGAATCDTSIATAKGFTVITA